MNNMNCNETNAYDECTHVVLFMLVTLLCFHNFIVVVVVFCFLSVVMGTKKCHRTTEWNVFYAQW